MGVSHETLDRLCCITLKHGLHSKLTGAGGGGCAVTLLRPDTSQDLIETVQKELTQLGFVCFETVVGGPGVLASILQ